MPVYDRECNHCGRQSIDLVEPISSPDLPCGCDNGLLKRKLLPGSAPSVIPDSIPGGMMINHGICNDDGSPRRYDSKSEMRQVAAAKNMVNRVEHVGTRGSDKSKHTVRWDVSPAALLISEEDRLAQWHAWDRLHGITPIPQV